MKAKLKSTGEIVDVISYKDISTASVSKYLVSYIDSQGIEHSGEGVDYYSDFEYAKKIQDKDSQHWQDVRERAAIAALQGLLANPKSFYSSGTMKEGIASTALRKGYALAAKLKEEQEEEQIERMGVKKVNFEVEFYSFTEKNGFMYRDIKFSDMKETARFFFELGLKTQK